MKKRVLILCTGNSCRSQMAEAFWESLGGDNWEAASAGSKPAGYVHPLAVQALAEVGLDIASQQSKHVDRFAAERFDLVITVCDHAKESCPAIAGARQTLHWPFADPAEATGDVAAQLAAFRQVRDLIKARIEEFLAYEKA